MLSKLFGGDKQRQVARLIAVVTENPAPWPILAAVQELVALGEAERAKAALATRLHDPRELVVTECAKRLVQFEDPELTTVLIAALPNARNYPLKVLLEAIGDSGGALAYPCLAAYVDTAAAGPRSAAIAALGKLGDPRALALLEPLRDDTTFVWQDNHSPVFDIGFYAREAIARINARQERKD